MFLSTLLERLSTVLSGVTTPPIVRCLEVTDLGDNHSPDRAYLSPLTYVVKDVYLQICRQQSLHDNTGRMPPNSSAPHALVVILPLHWY